MPAYIQKRSFFVRTVSLLYFSFLYILLFCRYFLLFFNLIALFLLFTVTTDRKQGCYPVSKGIYRGVALMTLQCTEGVVDSPSDGEGVMSTFTDAPSPGTHQIAFPSGLCPEI